MSDMDSSWREQSLRAASRRLQQLIDAGATLHPTGRDCKYPRECAYLRLNGDDVAGIMVRDGHAVPYNGRTKRRGWCS
jgi:endonuclease YncB( thermonuclease family)